MGTVYRIDASPRRLNNDHVAQVMAKRVRDWRHAHNAAGEPKAAHEQPITQLELATLAGVSGGTVQGIERGLRKTRRKSLVKLAAAMRMTVAQLTEGDVADQPLVVPDPRGKDLRDEDYEIARLFRTASTDVKLSVRNQLRVDALGLPPSVPVPAELNRRTGRDRRDTAGERAAVGPLDATAEAVAQEKQVADLVARLRRRLLTDPAFMASLEKHLALLDEHRPAAAAMEGEKKPASTPKRRA